MPDRFHLATEGGNRRVHPRYSVSFPCLFYTSDREYEGLLRNLSIDGAFIQAPQAPTVNEAIDLEFEIKNYGKLKINTRIVHRSFLSAKREKLEGFGVCFVEFHENSLAILEELLNNLTESH
jgi:hypothetical protein